MKIATKIALAWMLLLFATEAALASCPNWCTSAIASNFNGTAIAEGDYIWFNAVVKINGLSASPVTVFVTQATITFDLNGKQYMLPVPPSEITFDTSTALATTDFEKLSPEIGSPLGWDTDLQFAGLAGNDFLGAVTARVPAGGIPGGVKNIVWQVTFSSNTPGLTANWQWAAAVYTNFDTDYNNLGVKPVDDNKASQYKNSDHAGTPENFKAYVIGGASGGGGSNYTGSYSGTGSCALTMQPTVSMTASH